MVVALRLAKSGYGNGDPEAVLKMRGDHVLAIIQYESFTADYEKALIQMNRENV